MALSLMSREITVFKTTRLLVATKKFLGKPQDGYNFPIAQFFYCFGIGVMELRKYYGRDYEVKPYLMSTPHLLRLSQSMATTFIYQREDLETYVKETKFNLAFKPYTYYGTNLCYMRSGMEFFFTSFDDVPVTTGKEFVPFSQFYNALAGDLVERFDVSLKFFVNNFMFKNDDAIPSMVPSSHWWWIEKIKNRTDIRESYY